MFTVRFFDILTGVHGVSHQAERRPKPGNENVTKRVLGWSKRP